MKLMVMFAAWAISAILVLPTVSQGQSNSIYDQVAAAIAKDDAPRRQA